MPTSPDSPPAQTAVDAQPAPPPPDNSGFTPAEVSAGLAAAAPLLEALVADRGLLAGVPDALRERFLIAAGQVSRPDKRAKRQLTKARRRGARREQKAADQLMLNRTGIRKLRESPIFETPRRRALLETGAPPPDAPPPASDPIGQTHEVRTCYCCRKQHTEIHAFYDQMCLTCGDLNFAKREQTADLRGRVALVTGARVKIGFQAAIMLLRSGAHVICTTRFPKDAARRYAAEPDFADWADRVTIHGIDLRHTPSVEAFCRHIEQQFDRLDYIINNACQTVRRPPAFYEHMMALETTAGGLSPAERRLLGPDTAVDDARTALADPSAPVATTFGGEGESATPSQVELLAEDRLRGNHLFPEGQLDADLQQVDLRTVNSWRLKMADVPTIELLEVHLVNAVAPYILNARLKPLMMRTPERDKHIVNVSAMEGQFYRVFKTDRHPHTNMAKASLNMMTRTSAIDYKADGIHMNSVDTGWVTDEDPAEQAKAKREIHRFHPPLDIVDGAARITDPIFTSALTGEHVWGQFLKDYVPTDW